MWRRIDVQADVYGRAPNPTPWDFTGVFHVPIQNRYRTILSILPRPDPSIIQLDNGKIQCANAVKIHPITVAFYDAYWDTKGIFF